MKTNNDQFELIRRCKDAEATPEELAQLESCLLSDRDFREAYIRYMNLDVALRAAVQVTLVPSGKGSESQLRPNDFLTSRPLAAGLAGLVIGLCSASVLFAFGIPKATQQVLMISNAGFEEPIAPRADGIPLRFGAWCGDYSEVVGIQDGIVPHEGKRMFRFLRSNSSRGDEGPPYNGNMYQLIDVRPLQDAITSGVAVDWSAWFNCLSEAPSGATTFEASMWAFDGDPALVRKNWVEKLHQELAYSSWRIQADNDLQSWQRIAGSVFVPPDTDFLVIELKVIPRDPVPENDAVTFAGHFADDVQLVLRTVRSNRDLD